MTIDTNTNTNTNSNCELTITVLGYKNPSNALVAHVDEEDNTTVVIPDAGTNYKSKTTFISESGLYALILSLKLPN